MKTLRKNTNRYRSISRWLLAPAVFVAASVFATPAYAATLILVWDPNPEPHVAGYQVSWGTSSGNYSSTIDVGLQTTYAFVEPDATKEYFFSVRAYDSDGLVSRYATEIKSQPAPAPMPPSIGPIQTAAVGTTTATLAVTVNPRGAPTVAFFEFGATPSFGHATTPLNIGWGLSAVAINDGAIAGLACGTTYYVRAVAANLAGNVAGQQFSFSTGACPRPRGVATFVTATDFDGNGAADIAIFKPWNASWWIAGKPAVSWGQQGDIPVAGDYDGDGTTDVAVYRPATGDWLIRSQFTAQWGAAGDIPVPGDYDGNGTTDLAVFRASTGTWWVRGQFTVQWGHHGDVPVPGDYDGDGTLDLAVYRPSTGTWWIRNQTPIVWGEAGDIPVPGDYDGDGRTDLAVYRPSTGTWRIVNRQPVQWGAPGDIPVPADYDGDGSSDIMIYRPGTGSWWPQGQAPLQWGNNGDVALAPPPFWGHALPH